ncbi:uncharacterized protein LOC122656477 isoform X2 [Telopea speciosissima]|uniref:uncharacterized protein LOC122656477 isoform X2 n=1 Tax=Telopea speciosissima TaxID=54955 RepID=UPI001CC367C1|nr:uncharacterized protein LOC122656477 isoform X2 [Telopea speciosissima]
MKREGRQHGLVRSYEIWPAPWNPKRYNKIVNQIDSPATAGIFMKVSSKPTNHSKCTGKCGRPRCMGCHTHPVSKSRDKAKGTQKEKSFDDRNRGGSNYVGVSATAFLGQLATRDYQDWEDYDDEEEQQKEMEYGVGDDVYYGNDYCNNDNLEDIAPILTTARIEEIVHEPEEDADENDDDDDRLSIMSFCEVGFVMEMEEEGWFVVAEM